MYDAKFSWCSTVMVPVVLLVHLCAAFDVESKQTHHSAPWRAAHVGDLYAGPGSESVPCKRYGAPLVSVGSHHLLLFGGYFYDHPRSAPTWLCDLWTFDTRQSTWTRRGTMGNGPRASYKNSAAVVGPWVFIFGGDDGGNSRHASSHVWGAYSNTLHILDTATWRWLHPVSISGGSTPAARQSATLTTVPSSGNLSRLVGLMVLFGGLSASRASSTGNTPLFDQSDVHYLRVSRHELDEPPRSAPQEGQLLVQLSWKELRRAPGAVWPQPRRAHAAVSSRTFPDKLYIVGGFSGADDAKNFNDVWELNVDSSMWTQLAVNDAGSYTSPTPRPRGGLAAALSSTGELFISGGAQCVVGCTCFADTWRFSVVQRVWVQVSSGGVRPIARHFHSSAVIAADDGSSQLFIFGGESYEPYAYWNDVWQLDLANASNGIPSTSEPPLARDLFYEGMPGMLRNLMFRVRDAEMDQTCSDRRPSAAEGAGDPLPSADTRRLALIRSDRRRGAATEGATLAGDLRWALATALQVATLVAAATVCFWMVIRRVLGHRSHPRKLRGGAANMVAITTATGQQQQQQQQQAHRGSVVYVADLGSQHGGTNVAAPTLGKLRPVG